MGCIGNVIFIQACFSDGQRSGRFQRGANVSVAVLPLIEYQVLQAIACMSAGATEPVMKSSGGAPLNRLRLPGRDTRPINDGAYPSAGMTTRLTASLPKFSQGCIFSVHPHFPLLLSQCSVHGASNLFRTPSACYASTSVFQLGRMNVARSITPTNFHLVHTHLALRLIRNGAHPTSLYRRGAIPFLYILQDGTRQVPQNTISKHCCMSLES